MDPRQSRRGWDGGDDVNPGSMSPRQTAGPQDRRRSLNIDHSFLSHLAATHSGGFANTNSNTHVEPSSSDPTPPPREASAPLHSTNTPAANREGEVGAVTVVPPPALQSASATQAETGGKSGTPPLPKQERASRGGSKRSPPRASTKAKEAPRAVPLMPEGSGIPPDHPQSAHFPPFPQDGPSGAPRTSVAGQARAGGGGSRRGSGPKNADANQNQNVAASRRSDRRAVDVKGSAPPPPLATPVIDSPPMLPMQWRPCPGLTLRFKDVHITDAAAPIEDFLRKPVLVRPTLVNGAAQHRSNNIPPTATDTGHQVSPLSNLDGPVSGAAGSSGACGKDGGANAQADRERSVSAFRVAPAFPPTGEFSPASKEEMFETPASSENRTRGSIGYRGAGSDLVSDGMAGGGSRCSPPSRPAGPKTPPPPTAGSSGTFHPASSSVIDTSSAGASLTNNACGGVAEPGIAARLSHAVNSATHAVSVKVRHSLPGAWNSVERKCRGLKPHAVVTGATGTFYAGTVSAIVAVNQEEASALVDVLCGVRVPDIGDVWADRYPVTSSRFSRSVGVVQLDDWAYPELTVADNLEFAASMRTGGRVEHLRERVTAVLKLMALDPDWSVKTLSHSERRRLAVGMELVTDPPAVVVHNPLFGLDRHAAAEFIGLLCHVATFFQKTVVVTLPELPTFVCAALHSCIILGGDGGRSVFAGSVDEVEPFFASLKLRALAHTTHRPATTFAPLPEAPYAGDVGLNPSFAVDARASMYTGAGAAGMSSTARHFAGPNHATATPVKRQHAPSQSQSQSASQSAAASRGVSPEAVATRPPRQTSPLPEGHKTPLSDLQRALSEGNEDEYERAFTGAHALDYVFLWAQTTGATKKFAQLFQASEVFSRICQEHNSFLYGPAAATGSGATTSPPPPQPGGGDGRAKTTGVSGSVTSAAGIRSHRPPPQIEADWETATQATSVPAPVRFWRLFKITLWSRIRQTENYVLWAVFTLSLTLCVWLVKAQKETQLGLFNIRGIVFFLFLMTLQANNMQAPVLLNDTKRFARLKRSGIDVPLSFLAVLITFMIATRVIFLVPLGAAVALLISGSDMTSLFGLAGCLSATHGVLVLLLILYAKRIDGWVQWVLVGFVAYSTLFSGFLLNIRTSPASDLSKLSLVRYGYGAALVDYLQTQLFACELVRGSHGEPVNCYTGKAYLEGQGFEDDTVRGTLAGYGIVAGVGLVLAGIVLSKGF